MSFISRSYKFMLLVLSRKYYLKAKANNRSLHKYCLYSYGDNGPVGPMLSTDSKSELKVKMAVYGLKFTGCFQTYSTAYGMAFGRYAYVEMDSTNSRSFKHVLVALSDSYLRKAKAYKGNKSICKYRLYSYPKPKAVPQIAIETDSKSILKLKMAVYGLRFSKNYRLYDSAFGRYADIDVEEIAGES